MDVMAINMVTCVRLNAPVTVKGISAIKMEPVKKDVQIRVTMETDVTFAAIVHIQAVKNADKIQQGTLNVHLVWMADMD